MCPEGPFGGPRATTIGPFSREVREDFEEQWDECPDGGREEELCQTIKDVAVEAIETEGVFPGCDTLEDINSGRCHDVARAVDNQLGYTTRVELLSGGHGWLRFKGKHYDAEAPSGVSTPWELPFFNRIPPQRILERTQQEAFMREEDEVPETVDDMVVEVPEDA